MDGDMYMDMDMNVYVSFYNVFVFRMVSGW